MLLVEHQPLVLRGLLLGRELRPGAARHGSKECKADKAFEDQNLEPVFIDEEGQRRVSLPPFLGKDFRLLDLGGGH